MYMMATKESGVSLEINGSYYNASAIQCPTGMMLSPKYLRGNSSWVTRGQSKG